MPRTKSVIMSAADKKAAKIELKAQIANAKEAVKLAVATTKEVDKAVAGAEKALADNTALFNSAKTAKEAMRANKLAIRDFKLKLKEAVKLHAQAVKELDRLTAA